MRPRTQRGLWEYGQLTTGQERKAVFELVFEIAAKGESRAQSNSARGEGAAGRVIGSDIGN